jgi:hypothetical protein
MFDQPQVFAVLLLTREERRGFWMRTDLVKCSLYLSGHFASVDPSAWNCSMKSDDESYPPEPIQVIVHR